MSLFALLSKILFVGHSLVGPDLPGMVERGLALMGDEVQVQSQIINGASLAYGWDHSDGAEGVDGKAALAMGDVTALILTEAQPVEGHVQWSDTPGLVARWAEAAPGAEVYLYETWPTLKSALGAMVEGDPGAGLPWRQRIEADLPLWVQAAGDHARIIPAGQAMGLLADEIAAGNVPGLTSIQDVFADDIHPNGRGFYFVTMVHLAVLTGRSPEGLPARLVRSWTSRDDALTEDQALAFQRIAWAAVQGFPAQVETILARPAPETVPETALATAPEVPPPPGVHEKITNPALTLGLAGVNDWSVQQPFLDVMKTARPWTGHQGDQWGGWEEADLRAAGALDAEGWPVFLPEGVSGIATLILTDLPETAGGVAGRYVVTWQGRGDLRIEGRAQGVTFAEGRAEFDYTPGEGAVILTLLATDRANPLRRIQVVRADRAEALAAGEIFNPDWLSRIEGIRGLRFMDWMATNDSALSRAADRPLPGDYSWARKGVPLEVMVALANRLKAEPWFTLPHLADDGFIRIHAGIVSRELDPGLRAWVEFSNEVWNPQFAQGRWADEQGRARWGVEGAGLQFYGTRAAQVMQVWCEVMDCARVVRVVATQTGILGAEAQILDAPLEVAAGGRAPAGSFDAYAVTGYFSGLLGAEHKLPAVRAWIAESETAAGEAAKGLTGAAAAEYATAHRFDLAVERAVAELRDGSSTGAGEDTLAQVLGTVLPHHAQVAKDRGLVLAMYEGGTHVVSYGAAVDEPVLEAFFIQLNFSPGMGALYGQLLAGWKGLTDQPFNAFVDVYTPNKWGSWGALRHLDDDNPRWRALARGCDPC